MAVVGVFVAESFAESVEAVEGFLSKESVVSLELVLSGAEAAVDEVSVDAAFSWAVLVAADLVSDSEPFGLVGVLVVD